MSLRNVETSTGHENLKAYKTNVTTLRHQTSSYPGVHTVLRSSIKMQIIKYPSEVAT
jgi:hypothetical protein